MAGAKGATGPKGATGSQGPKGDQGATGPQGPGATSFHGLSTASSLSSEFTLPNGMKLTTWCQASGKRVLELDAPTGPQADPVFAVSGTWGTASGSPTNVSIAQTAAFTLTLPADLSTPYLFHTDLLITGLGHWKSAHLQIQIDPYPTDLCETNGLFTPGT